MAAPSKKKVAGNPLSENPFLALAGKLTCEKEGRVVNDNYEEIVFPTASIVLDDVLRLQGIPFNGRMIHIHGNPHGGKSTIGYGCIREFQASGIGGGYCAIWDWEKTCTPKYLRQLGVDSSKVKIFRPSNLKMALHDAYLMAKEGGVRLHMIDSIAMMQNSADEKEILNGEALNARVGRHAKVVSEFFTEYMAIAADFDLSTICINQTRARIDTSREGQLAMKYPTMVNLPYDLPGGRKPRFLSSIMLEVNINKEYYGARAKDSDFLMEPEPKVKVAPIVNRVDVRVLKNKVNEGGFRKGHLWIRPGKGVDDLISIRELAVEYDLISYVAGKGYRVGSEDEVIIMYPTKDEAITNLVTTPDMDVLFRLKKLVSAAVLDDDSSRAVISADEAALTEDGEMLTSDIDGDDDIELAVPVKKGRAKAPTTLIDVDNLC